MGRSQRQGDEEALENLLASPWNGSGAKGPFLATGDVWTERFELDGGRLDVRLAWPAAPEPHLVDDLQLVVRLSDGTEAIAGTYQNDGDSTLFLSDVVNFSNSTTFPNKNETTIAITLSEDDLENIEWVDISSDDNVETETKKGRDELYRRMHVLKNGQIISGAKTFLIIWKKIPRYNFLYKFFNKPIIFPIFNIIYEFIAYFLYLKIKLFR